MEAKDFFKQDEIRLPLTREINNTDFYKYFSDVVDKYLEIIEAISISGRDSLSRLVDTKKDTIESLCEAIKITLKKYLDGHSYEAFGELEKQLTKNKSILSEQWTHKEGNIETNRLYRMRTGLDIKTRKDIFHIPFEDRHKVATQRYSVPGLPCLYLGGSLYICWQELGCPNFEDIYVSSFTIRECQSLQFLDFSTPPQSIKPNTRRYDDDFLSKQIILWPLIASCSVKTLHSDCAFKAEYIIPQMLLQWITRNSDYDGIKHFSTHTNRIPTKEDGVENPHWICNYILPVKEVKPTGYCQTLANNFKLTKPFPWKILRSSHILDSGNCVDHITIEIIPGFKEPYELTEFGSVQANLNCIMQTQAKLLQEKDSI